MHKIFTTLFIAFLLVNTSNAQTIDSIKLSVKEIPEGYALTAKLNCISIQACTFYNNPGTYEMLTGKVKEKQI